MDANLSNSKRMGLMTDSDWRENANGNFYNFINGHRVVVFEKKSILGGWGAVCNGLFTKRHFRTAEDAMEAIETEDLVWIDIDEWKASKKGGYYRRDDRYGVVSVKRAKSGQWYWIATSGVEGIHGWFDTAEEAKNAADRYLSARANSSLDDDDELIRALDAIEL